ncbi:SURF1 family protein [Phytoactinopolyspora halophila]|uniref:SURF1 family cytochrome oxidase biogenesis protein n=1 Tax=Phytoactinopolyspora halophila TaxID=1981511 RepID=UPI0013147482|nr:SURF1 family protein [Phytoactinopolyspora halophila]
MYRFLATRRWLIRILAGIVLIVACVRLGMWQLDRDDERSARNDVIEDNASAAAVHPGELLDPAEPFDPEDEWRQVEVRGQYDAEHELVLRLRPLEGERGVRVITPLITETGTALLVNRGFYPSAEQIPEAPPPPDGDVEVVARLRASEDGEDVGGDLAAGHIRYVNVADIAEALPYPVYPAWAEAVSPIDDELVALPPPEVDPGPHLSYAIQWFIFAVIGVGGFVLLVRAEARERRAVTTAAAEDSDKLTNSAHLTPTEDVDRVS